MKILIELPSWLGDSVMTTPAIENIVSYFKDPEITLIGPKISIAVFKSHPNVVRAYEIKKNIGLFYKFSKDLGFFDIYISFRGSIRSRTFKLFVKSLQKYQFDKNKYRGVHQVEKYNNFINDALGISFDPNELKIYQKKKISANSKIQTVGINPGASFGDAKRWQTQDFAEVIIGLSKKYFTIILGGPNEVDIAYAIESIIKKNGVTNYQNLAGKTSVEELIDTISTLNLFITGDSGPMHLAASFKVPTVAIFGPTNEHETSQWMVKNSLIIKNNLSCQPCMKRKCPLGHNNCMVQVKSDKVLLAAENLV